MFDNIAIAGVSLTGILGFAAFLVSVVVEFTKEVKPFSLMPTRLWCMTVSAVLCLCAYFGYCAYLAIPAVWYLAVCALVASVIVSYIAMYGWDTLKDLLDRFKLP